MLKQSFLLIFLLLFVFALPAYASEASCEVQIADALTKVMGKPAKGTEKKKEEGTGYFKELDDLTSTNLQPYVLIDEVEILARKAKVEMNGLCQESSLLETMDQDYASVYKLSECKKIKATERADIGLSVFRFCQDKQDLLLQEFLNTIPSHLLLNSIRTAMDPFLERMRGINSKITMLIAEYNRLVKNFFTFNFRLGERVLKNPD